MMRTIKQRLVGLVAAAALAAPLLVGAAAPAHARYDVPVMESECPPGTHPQLVANSSLPGYPVYCAPN